MSSTYSESWNSLLPSAETLQETPTSNMPSNGPVIVGLLIVKALENFQSRFLKEAANTTSLTVFSIKKTDWSKKQGLACCWHLLIRCQDEDTQASESEFKCQFFEIEPCQRQAHTLALSKQELHSDRAGTQLEAQFFTRKLQRRTFVCYQQCKVPRAVNLASSEVLSLSLRCQRPSSNEEILRAPEHLNICDWFWKCREIHGRWFK